MSETERIKGRLVLINISENEAKDICQKHGIEWYDKSWIYTLAAEHDDYCYLKNIGLCKVEYLKSGDIYGCTIRKDGDVIEFDAVYYNGGAHWTEVVEDALSKINEGY